MLATDLDNLLRQIGNPSVRPIVADALEEAGRYREADLLRSDRPCEAIPTAYGWASVVVQPRLTQDERYDAIMAFVAGFSREPNGEDELQRAVAECAIQYRDDHDTGWSWYQIVDGQGHGDGSGEWTEVAWATTPN